MAGSQDFAVDPRNADLRIYVNGALVPRAEAKVSVFDAGFVLGDGVWEGLRLHKGAAAVPGDPPGPALCGAWRRSSSTSG